MKSAHFFALTAVAVAVLTANAEWLSKTKDATGFEGISVGTVVTTGIADDTQGGASESHFILEAAAGAENATKVLAYAADADKPTGTLPADFANSGNNYLKLNTEGSTLFRNVNVGDDPDPVAVESSIYFDSTMQFTVSEEAPTVAYDDTDVTKCDKIAVWLNADKKLCVKVGFADDSFNLTAKDYVLDCTIEPNSWHRLTIVAIKNVLGGDYVLPGFQVRIDGVAQAIAAGDGVVMPFANADVDNYGGFNAAYATDAAANKVFPALGHAGLQDTAYTMSVKGVGFQGTGIVDNFVATTHDPADPTPDYYNREVTIDTITGLTLSKVTTDAEGKVVVDPTSGKYVVPNGTTIYAWFQPNGAYVLKGDGVYSTTVSGNLTIGQSDVASLYEAATWYNGTTYYAAAGVADAIAAATESVTLLQDAALADTLTINKAIAFDLGGKVLTLPSAAVDGIVVTAGATVQNGTIQSALTGNAAGKCAVQTDNTSASFEDLTINAAGYEYCLALCDSYNTLAEYYTAESSSEVYCENVDVTGNGLLIYAQGAYVSLDENCSAVASVSDTFPLFANVTHQSAIYSAVGAQVDVAGGTYMHQIALLSGNLGGEINASAGTFTGTIKSWMTSTAHDELEAYDNYKAKFNLSGGTYSGPFAEEEADCEFTVWNVTGGTYAVDPTAYLAAGYAATKNGEVWTVAALPDVVQIGEKNYKSLADAIKDAESGNTLKLLADTTAGDLTIGTAITLDTNGKTLTIAKDDEVTVNAALTFAAVTVEGTGLKNEGTINVNADLDLSNLNWGTGLVASDAKTAKFVIDEGNKLKFAEFAGNNPNTMETALPGFLSGSDNGALFVSGSTTWTYDSKLKGWFLGEVTAPTAETGLAYTGEEQTGVASGDNYTLSDTFKATDAGNYQATATLAAEYKWSDGSTEAKVIDWSIAQADSSITTAPTAPTAVSADVLLSTVELVGGEGSVAGSFAWTDGSTVVTNTDTYEVTFTPTDAKNYKTATCMVTVTVSAPTPTVPEWIDPTGDPEGAQKYSDWAKANDVTDPANAKQDAFLLNCANNDEAIAAAKAEFTITSITIDPATGEVTVVGPDASKYNGSVIIKGSATVDGEYTLDADNADAKFFKAILKRIPAN